MRRKTLVIGLAAGLLAVLVLYYPLHVVLPAKHVTGWEGGNTVVALILQIVAGLIVVASGYLAASEKTRFENMCTGAIAGTIAGFLVYWLIAAAAAGITGSHEILQHGAIPAANDAAFNSLLADTVLEVIFLVYQAMWNLIFGAAALGALGGVFAPLQKTGESDETMLRHVRLPISVAFLLSAVLTLVVSITVFSLLPESIQQAADAVGYTTQRPARLALTYPASTAILIFLFGMLWTTSEVRWAQINLQGREAGSHRILGYMILGIGLGFVIIMLLINRSFTLSPLGWVMSIASVSIGLYAFWLTRGIKIDSPEKSNAYALFHPQTMKNHRGILALGIPFAMLIPSFAGIVQASLALVLIPITMIPVLSSYAPDADPVTVSYTLESLVQSLYQTQFLALGLGLFGTMVLMFGLFSGVGRILQRTMGD